MGPLGTRAQVEWEEGQERETTNGRPVALVGSSVVKGSRGVGWSPEELYGKGELCWKTEDILACAHW